MRYFGFVLKTNSEQIKENAKIRLKEYDYQSTVAAMNNYMYKNMKNGICYFAYREDGGTTLAAFSYDEKKGSFRDAYDYIIEMLNDVFSIKQVKAEPCEITMYQFYECLLEAKRREYFLSWTRILEAANIRVYDYFKNEQITFHYNLKEKIISENHKKENPMYDKSVINELSIIESHKNMSGFKGNMVHYIISSRSAEAANDITETLMQKLAESNRLSGRRMEIISEIEPDLYNVNNHLEEFIENNYGGVIVIDLSEKFGYDSVDYEMTCKYIEKLVKKYRNDCLFVFTYNIEKPGFAYQFLPLVRKHVISVMLKEGKGDRKAAVNYMKELIKASEYSKYARLANEFMKLFPGNIFSQTDVLMAFEQFEPWCLNRNVLQAYDYNYSDTFMLDRDENNNSSYDKLNKMIGLTSVKEQINHIIAADIVEKERKKRQGNAYELGTMHMIFGGNPGSAKTTVARLFTEIMKDEKVLSSGNFVEVGRADLVGDHVGATAPLVRKKFREAQGGVLFIDEAYSLCDSYENGFGDEAINTLVQEMENHRDDVIVIFAGYSDQMKAFLDRNPGMSSRIAFHVDFEDYFTNELCDITRLMLSRKQMKITEAAMEKLKTIYESERGSRGFGNGRFVRKMLEEAEMNLAERVSQFDESTITTELITTIEERDIPEPDAKKHPKKKQVGFCVA